MKRFFLLLLAVATAADAQLTINVDAAANRRAIDPRIYGVSFADAATITDLGLTLNRWGGNRTTRYNWQTHHGNTARDYFFENVDDAGPFGIGTSDSFITLTHGAGARPVMTVPMIGWTAKDATSYSFSVLKYGAQQSSDPFKLDAGNGFRPDGVTQVVNDPTDASVAVPSTFSKSWIEYLVATYGSAAAGGVRYYGLDNEPALWSYSHFDIHPEHVTYDEAWSKMEEYGAAIRAVDANAVITGPEEWQWTALFTSQKDWMSGNSDDRNAHGGTNYGEWLLQKAADYESNQGRRILDIFTVHYYPQGNPAVSATETEFSSNVSAGMQALRNRSTRALWDPNYVNESWMGTVTYPGTPTLLNEGKTRVIPMLREWVTAHYPGTQIGVTEYNWGADAHINGGTAQADILGIFGREGLDMGVRWESPPAGSFTYNAFKMYRNYDGAQSRFGDVSVSASAPDPDQVSAFAALRTSDGALTIMLVSKTAGAKNTTVNLANFVPAPGAQAQERHLYDNAGAAAISAPVSIPLAGGTVSVTLPGQSVTLLVIPGARVGTAPASVAAQATSSSQVSLSWTAVPLATRYDIYRSSKNNPYAYVQSSATTATTDTGLFNDTTYLYKVMSSGPDGTSALSALDPATTTPFTDDPLNVGVVTKAAHFMEMRRSVNAMRAAAGLEPQVWTDPGLGVGTPIRAVHLTDLRSALNAARTALLLSAVGGEVIVAGTTTIKRDHVVGVRNGVR